MTSKQPSKGKDAKDKEELLVDSEDLPYDDEDDDNEYDEDQKAMSDAQEADGLELRDLIEDS